jgi:hypothetical protein
MLACALLLLGGAAALALYLKEKLRRYSVKAVLRKGLVSALFVALAACAWYVSAKDGGPKILGVFVIAGLVFGLLGDIWLDMKYVFPQADGPFTYAGFASFGIGHVLYCAGLALQFAEPGKAAWIWLPLLPALVLGLSSLGLEKPMKLHYGKFRPVVAAYSALLFSTLLLSGSLALLHGWSVKTLNLFFIGAVLFAVSDLILSGTYFGRGRERPVDLLLNYLTYYPAQFLIAWSLLYL